MRRPSRLTPMQQAARRSGRPGIAFMSNAARRAAGLMDRQQAVEHERLAMVPHVRLAERSKGPAPDDIWATAGGDAQ